MSVKKSPQVNSSPKIKCGDVISEINDILKKIKLGAATKNDFKVCENLTNTLQDILGWFSDIDSSDRWLAKETIEMSRYTCKKYGAPSANDKI